MIYIATLLVLIILVCKYDLSNNKRENWREGNIAFIVTEMWFIAISAFQYRMGADIVSYMIEFDDYKINYSWGYISGFDQRYPGWVLLNILCKSIINDFVFLKTVIAIFVNHAFFYFFKKNSSFPFVCVLLYSLVIYLPLNFNILRQSVSIAFFLYAYKYLKERKYIIYYMYSLVALFFHSSSIILLLVPFFNLLMLSKRKSLIAVFTLVILNILTYTIPNFSLLIISVSETLPSFLLESGSYYLENENYISYHANFFGFLQGLVFSLFFIYIYIRNQKDNIGRTNYTNQKLLYAFIFLYILNGVFPILYRFNQFLYAIYIVSAASVVVNFIKVHKIKEKSMFMACVVLIFGFIHLGSLFQTNKINGEKPLIQYYPYYTVIDKGVDPTRERLWGDRLLNR